MSEQTDCPQCSSPYAYPMGEIMICPECNHEWNPQIQADLQAQAKQADELIVKDVNGNRLANGDDVTIIKSLPVKGAPKPIKIGTKVNNITLVDGDHNISCKVPGFGAMMLKSEFVKKA